MTSFQLHKERKKERKGLFREGQSRLSRTKMQVCLHPGRGPPTNVPPSGPDPASDASLVHPRHPAASSDKPFRLFLHPLICLSLNVPRTFYSKIQQQDFPSSPSPSNDDYPSHSHNQREPSNTFDINHYFAHKLGRTISMCFYILSIDELICR